MEINNQYDYYSDEDFDSSDLTDYSFDFDSETIDLSSNSYSYSFNFDSDSYFCDSSYSNNYSNSESNLLEDYNYNHFVINYAKVLKEYKDILISIRT